AVEFKKGDDTQVAVIPSTGGVPEVLTSGRGESWSYSFAPGGDKIAFAGFRGGRWNVYWISRATKEEKAVTSFTKLNSYVRYPSWSPSGDVIAFEFAETNGNIWMAEGLK
ncbi:MAG TPA: hypothetical protein VGR00_01610, partial [Thermoanaerobaculia bacterium]|nr:hypothetical protein [Thermoanaerobaculia bacterium]